MRVKATGSWAGHYTYDPVPDCPDLPTRTGFGMRLTESWLLGTLRGDVWDEPPGDVSVRGAVGGRATPGGVFFLKRMPAYLVWRREGLMPLGEYLAAEFGLFLDRPVPHPPLRYTGRYRAGGEELAGTWRFAPGVTRVLCGGKPHEIRIQECRGKWEARRRAAEEDGG
jgi:hypothetical protein